MASEVMGGEEVSFGRVLKTNMPLLLVLWVVDFTQCYG